ncbi:uncharacterized protein Z520_04086 [Fonsecaea multimorphosa CBS 102226]|uniref:Uncharacterized protein n=1 Tax=Fonsecaea multimorphosa CBS 102226 TaxID=1442371 RepID=A0A0D2HEW0_9EURO|nr:uncharacterized protein Z520_04086 [Fonsecaea multimorphosa CBS 102226]KIY00401.1 hypothetical protein Z520_04086 [Fonsecaea multimorphosa CBS 102226]OAL26917.1 hypothetical protein AYO22_03861 [Fonsecaea multimorphosa]
MTLNIDLSLLPILLLATPSSIPPIHTAAALGTYTDTEPALPSVLGILLDACRLCLGMQRGLNPAALNQGEFPACAAMTTGYVFRVENHATVMYLQKIGRTGHLTTLDVHPPPPPPPPPRRSHGRPPRTWFSLSSMPVLLLVTSSTLTTPPPSLALMTSLSCLLLSRILAIISLRARTSPPSWHGAPEPGVPGDLLVLLSEDRWIRMRGLVDDLKAVTSGAWLARPRNPALMDALDWIAHMAVYLAVVALAGASDGEKVMLLGAVVASHLALMYENSTVDGLVMNGRTVTQGSVKKYPRRLDMAEELVEEVGRSDFAVRLGLINPDKVAEKKETEKDGLSVVGPGQEVVTM